MRRWGTHEKEVGHTRGGGSHMRRWGTNEKEVGHT